MVTSTAGASKRSIRASPAEATRIGRTLCSAARGNHSKEPSGIGSGALRLLGYQCAEGFGEAHNTTLPSYRVR
jgi:hypothetical protein